MFLGCSDALNKSVPNLEKLFRVFSVSMLVWHSRRGPPTCAGVARGGLEVPPAERVLAADDAEKQKLTTDETDLKT